MQEKEIKIAGLGGVGFWLTVALSQVISDHITGYDPDTLAGGMGYTRLPVGAPGMSKVQLLEAFLLSQCECIATVDFVAEYLTSNHIEKGDWFIDCTDMAIAPRRQLWAEIKEKSPSRMLRVSYDGARSTVVVAEGLPLVGSPQGGYQNVPSLGLSLMAGGIGAETISTMILDGHKDHVEFQVSIKELITLNKKEKELCDS